jgi:enterochelin esterase-like enzyme
MTRLSAGGLEAIVIGVPNQGEARMWEYNPFAGGGGEAYLRFLVETVKPRVDEDFRTLPGPEHTTLAGSSMGGLISLYGMLTYPRVFGRCGAFSPAFWFGDFGLYRAIPERASGQGRIYLDVGGQEGATFGSLPEPWRTLVKDPDQAYLDGVRRLCDLLVQAGYRPDSSLMYVEEKDGLHNEKAWARRLPEALRFLLAG